MLKTIHAQEGKKAARKKAKAVVEELRSMKMKEVAIEDTSIAGWVCSSQSLQIILRKIWGLLTKSICPKIALEKV